MEKTPKERAEEENQVVDIFSGMTKEEEREIELEELRGDWMLDSLSQFME